MHAKFQVAGFQTKKDIRHRSLNNVCLFLLEHLLVHVTWWFLASDGSEIRHFLYGIIQFQSKTGLANVVYI